MRLAELLPIDDDQGNENGYIAGSIDSEAPRDAHRHNEGSCDNRPDSPRHSSNAAVQAYGVWELFVRGQVSDEASSHGVVYGIDQTLGKHDSVDQNQRRRGEPDNNRQGRRADCVEALGNYEDSYAAKAVANDPSEGSYEEDWRKSKNGMDTQCDSAIAEFEDDPNLSNELDPLAGLGNTLADRIFAEVPIAERGSKCEALGCWHLVVVHIATVALPAVNVEGVMEKFECCDHVVRSGGAKWLQNLRDSCRHQLIGLLKR